MSLRVALVGYGSAGRGIHAPLLLDAGMAPSAVVTADPQRVAQARAELPGADVVPELDAALRLELDLGVAIVVDKPLAVDAAQARDATARAAAAGVPLTVFQNRRWDTENLTLRALLQRGVLGRVHRFERRWERWRPVPKERWRERAPAAQGGGILLDLHPHLVDSAVQFFGPVERVYAEVSAWTTPAEDEAFLALRHAGGVVSHLTASSVAGAPGPRTRVLGSAGAYVVTTFEAEPSAFGGLDDLPGHCGWLVRGSEREAVPAAPGGHRDFYPQVRAALAEPDPARRQAAMPVDPRDAVHVLQVIDAARDAATGRVVTVPPA